MDLRPTIDFTLSGVLYNPFNKTLLALSPGHSRSTVFQFFKDQKLLRKFESAKDYSNEFMFIDDNLLLHTRPKQLTLVDFSADPVKETKNHMFSVSFGEKRRFFTNAVKTQLGRVISPESKDRIIFADARTSLVTICHLPSLQWETVYHLQATLTASNSRYFVGNNDEGATIIYDFLK